MSLRRAILEIGVYVQMLSRSPVGAVITLPDTEFANLLVELGLNTNNVNFFKPIDIGGITVTRDGMPPDGTDLATLGIPGI